MKDFKTLIRIYSVTGIFFFLILIKWPDLLSFITKTASQVTKEKKKEKGSTL